MNRPNWFQLDSKTPDLLALQGVAVRLASRLKPKTVMRISGELGAGKTQLVRFILQNLGFEEVSSPTFSIENRYPTANFVIHHFDLYRVESIQELEGTGFWDAFAQPNVILIEWPSLVPKSDIPLDWNVIDLEINNRIVFANAYAAC